MSNEKNKKRIPIEGTDVTPLETTVDGFVGTPENVGNLTSSQYEAFRQQVKPGGKKNANLRTE